jgi:AcrR family transcriptional regulator
VPPGNPGRAPGNAARERVVNEAATLATMTGIDGLSIGELAKRVDMPKSSLYVLFGSKEQLQLSTVDAARRSFVAEVVAPAMADGTDGRDRLLRLCEGFVDYVRRRVFPGGCFFVQAAAEMGGRSGPLHDRIAAYQGEWRDLLRRQARAAHARAETTEDPDQLAFELGAMLAGANLLAVLHDDDSACDRAAAALRRRLGAESPERTTIV